MLCLYNMLDLFTCSMISVLNTIPCLVESELGCKLLNDRKYGEVKDVYVKCIL